jgi:hypothetical protein
MDIVRTPRPATPQDVVDTELRGAWVVDVRRQPRSAVRGGWLVEWEDDIVFLTDLPEAPATWPPEAA